MTSTPTITSVSGSLVAGEDRTINIVGTAFAAGLAVTTGTTGLSIVSSAYVSVTACTAVVRVDESVAPGASTSFTVTNADTGTVTHAGPVTVADPAHDPVENVRQVGDSIDWDPPAEHVDSVDHYRLVGKVGSTEIVSTTTVPHVNVVDVMPSQTSGTHTLFIEPVLADGTYLAQTAFSVTSPDPVQPSVIPVNFSDLSDSDPTQGRTPVSAHSARSWPPAPGDDTGHGRF